MNHEVFMHRCLELAEQGRGFVGNGALVGSILVRDGKIIAEGFHAGFGLPHAERDLLTKFKGEVLPRDILYVNLEPCCHQGKTPPCTDILFERGVRTVVIGMQDPDKRVAGQGIAVLRDSGVQVIGPVLHAQSAWMNRGFVSVRTKGRPWVTVKRAQTVDGAIAKPEGTPLKITTQEQDVWSHTWLRAKHDAILVGCRTVISDNPRLDTRLDQHSSAHTPLIIVLDPQCRTPLSSRILQDSAARTIIVHAGDTEHGRVAAIQKTGARTFAVAVEDGSFAWEDLWKSLLSSVDDYQGITSILVEGGQRVWDTFKQADMLDEEVILIGKIDK